MASQVLADTEDGGGQMTANEIIDGNVNNLFPDISRLDRTYGRVSLRKAYLSVQTSDRATYFGAHVALTEQAADPLVNTTIFTTKDWFDSRESCRSRIEGYLVKGPSYSCNIWGDHYKGTKSVSILIGTDWTEPKIGDVLVFRAVKNLDGATITALEQYLRITDITSEVKTIAEGDKQHVRKHVKMTFGQALQFDIPGAASILAVTTGAGSVFTTVAADTSTYYGVTKLGVAAEAGALSIKAKETNCSLVPSANSQTAIMDFGPGMTRPVMLGSDNKDQEVRVSGSMSFSTNAVTTLGFGIKPGTFSFSTQIKDNGKGEIVDAVTLEKIGTIFYPNGTITMGENTFAANISGIFKFEPATKYESPAKSGAIIVEANNRGFVYVFNCHPSPQMGSLRVDFMSGGKWYSLNDVGNGELRGAENGIGTGMVNYITGSVSITLAAMPDINSMILIYWGVILGAYNINSYKTGFVPFNEFILEEEAEYGTLVISWDLDNGAETIPMEIKDTGTGDLVLFKDGVEKYQVGTYEKNWRRAKIKHLGYTPKNIQEYELEYETAAPDISRISEAITGTGEPTQTYVLLLDEDIKPGSVRITMVVTMEDPKIGDSASTTRQDSNSWAAETKSSSGSSQSESEGKDWWDWSGDTGDAGFRPINSVIMLNSTAYKTKENTIDSSGETETASLASKSLDIVGASSGTVNLYDIGTGVLYLNAVEVGTVNYTSGQIVLNQHFNLPTLTKETKVANSSDSSASSDSSSSSSGSGETDETLEGKQGTKYWKDAWGEETEVSAADGTKYSSSGAVAKTTVNVREATLKYVCNIADQITIKWAPVTAAGDVYTETATKNLKIEFPVAPGYHVQAGSLWLTDSTGKILKDDAMGKIRYLGINQMSEDIGDFNYGTGIMTMTKHEETDSGGLGFGIVEGLVTRGMNEGSYWCFRCPGAPITPGSFTLQVTAVSGEVFTATANFSGELIGDSVNGYISFSNGIVEVMFGKFYNWNAVSLEPWAQSAPQIEEGGVVKVWKHEMIQPSTMTMNCVVETYLPLDAKLLGLDPVRLPLDGKVPIFRDGYIILIHHSDTEVVMPEAGSIVELSRDGVDLIELYDNNGVFIPEQGNYSVDLADGEITFEDPLDLSAYALPFQALTRIEDMVIAIDVQITGHMGISQPLRHSYPADETLVSSVLPIGDMQARIYNVFTDSSWGSIWQDVRKYSPTTAQYDTVNYPIITTNRSSVKERFACIFTASNTVNVVGEKLGVMLANAPITSDISPINPANGQPYFTLRFEGWGAGWSSGQVLRFNSDAGNFPIWFCRTTRQGPATENSDHYTIQIRGDSA